MFIESMEGGRPSINNKVWGRSNKKNEMEERKGSYEQEFISIRASDSRNDLNIAVDLASNVPSKDLGWWARPTLFAQ